MSHKNQFNDPVSRVWVSDNGDGTFTNPVLYADYSDPDVIRVGSDFFMVASSFNCTPCLPILHSRDLVNWKIVNHVCDRIPYPGYEVPRHGCGVWAPSIRYHAGKYWVYFAMPDEGIFMSNTTDPFGQWSPLVCVKEVRGWIDPCPFWDDDGRAYLVNGFARSRIGFKSMLLISEMTPDGTALADDNRFVFDGHAEHPTIEGPKLYKRNGYYYIFAPAGGVATGWQTVLRSKHIYGPYEARIVMDQGDTQVNGPHQGAWVELDCGEHWFVHFQDAGAYGRVVHLQPMRWVDDWPVIGNDPDGDGKGNPVLTVVKPDVGNTYPIATPADSDEFDSFRLGLQWQWQANPRDGWYSLSANPGCLRLYAATYSGAARTLWEAPSLLAQKFPAPEFQVTVKLEFHPRVNGEKAGLAIMGEEFSYLCLIQTGTGLKLGRVWGKHDSGVSGEQELWEIPAQSGTVWLRVSVAQNGNSTFGYSWDGNDFSQAGPGFTAVAGRWIGAKIGLFCLTSQPGNDCGYADFDWIRFAK